MWLLFLILLRRKKEKAVKVKRRRKEREKGGRGKKRKRRRNKKAGTLPHPESVLPEQYYEYRQKGHKYTDTAKLRQLPTGTVSSYTGKNG